MKVSVVIPNRNDTLMLGLTVRNVTEQLHAIDGESEVVICDNSDEDIWRILLKSNASPLDLTLVAQGKVRLLRQKKPSLYAARQSAYRHAKGEYCINLDSHMTLGYGALKDMVDFMDSNPERVGYAYAPVGWYATNEAYARHDLRTDEGTIFGSWGRNYTKPTTVCWNFGFHICRRDWFINESHGYGSFASKHYGWGGGEFYTAIKAWLLGYQNWAIPCRPLYHVGPISPDLERLGYRYRFYDVSRSGTTRDGFGVLVAFYALGGDEAFEEAKKAQKHLTQYGINVERDWPEAKSLGEEDWQWLKKRQVMSLREFVETRPWQGGGWVGWEKSISDLKLSMNVKDKIIEVEGGQ